MAAFLSRTVDGALRRGSRRAALTSSGRPRAPRSSARDHPGPALYVKSDGRCLGRRTAAGTVGVRRATEAAGSVRAGSAQQILVAMGRSSFRFHAPQGDLYAIDPGGRPGRSRRSRAARDRPSGSPSMRGSDRQFRQQDDRGIGVHRDAGAWSPDQTNVSTGFSSLFDAIFTTNVWVTTPWQNAASSTPAAPSPDVTVETLRTGRCSMGRTSGPNQFGPRSRSSEPRQAPFSRSRATGWQAPTRRLSFGQSPRRQQPGQLRLAVQAADLSPGRFRRVPAPRPSSAAAESTADRPERGQQARLPGRARDRAAANGRCPPATRLLQACGEGLAPPAPFPGGLLKT
jgi:hypothetical protein